MRAIKGFKNFVPTVYDVKNYKADNKIQMAASLQTAEFFYGFRFRRSDLLRRSRTNYVIIFTWFHNRTGARERLH